MPIQWTDEQVKYLILCWESEPSLYKVAHPDYHNKLKRIKALTKIKESLISIGMENITNADISKKIHGLRTQFLMENNKIKKSKVSGASADDVYKPKLWSYPMLEFLYSVNLDASRTSISNLGAGDQADENKDHEASEEVIYEGPVEELSSLDLVECVTDTASPSTGKRLNKNEDLAENYLVDSPVSTPVTSGKNRKRNKNDDDLIQNFFTRAEKLMKSEHVQEDDINKFSQFICSEMHTIKNKALIRKLKMKVHEILNEIQEEDERLG